jgi:hypothetical protein
VAKEKWATGPETFSGRRKGTFNEDEKKKMKKGPFLLKPTRTRMEMMKVRQKARVYKTRYNQSNTRKRHKNKKKEDEYPFLPDPYHGYPDPTRVEPKVNP